MENAVNDNMVSMDFEKTNDNFLITLRFWSGLSNYLWYCVVLERRGCICPNDVRTGTERSKKDPTVDGNRTEADSTATPTAEPKPAKFVAKQGKRRKPGTGCISQVPKNTWQGKYTPWNPDGTRQCHVVYAKSYDECEKKLEEMIVNLNAGEESKTAAQ